MRPAAPWPAPTTRSSVRDLLDHAKLATTDRYVSANFRPEELERLDRAFGTQPATALERNV